MVAQPVVLDEFMQEPEVDCVGDATISGPGWTFEAIGADRHLAREARDALARALGPGAVIPEETPAGPEQVSESGA